MPDAHAAASPAPERAGATKGEGEPQDKSTEYVIPPSVESEAPARDDLASLSLGNQTQTPRFPDLQRKAEKLTLDLNANPSKDRQTAQAPDYGRQTALNLATAKPNASSSQPAVTSSTRVKSTPPVLTTRMALTPEPVAKTPIASLTVPMPETWQGDEVARSRYQTQTVYSMTAKIEKLERTVADLSAQVAARKDFQQLVTPTFPQPSQPQVIVQRSASQPRTPHAFLERSYVSRLYRWSRR